MEKVSLVLKRTEKLSFEVIKTLVGTIDAKDKYTNGHSNRVAEYSKMLATAIGLDKQMQTEIYYSALLHDIGKIGIPDTIINKSEKLTEEEYDIIKTHPEIGSQILSSISTMKNISVGARSHHEHFDGSGYPDSKKGDEISLIARIICVADAYDAMASNRSYRKALPQEVVRSEIVKGRGKQFDADIADIMLQMIDEDSSYSMRQTDNTMKNVLVVDDEIMNIRMAEHILKDVPDICVIGAKTKDETFRVLEENEIHLILLDLKMPDIDGFDLYKLIHEKYDIPVVIVTADKGIETIQKISELGIDDYLTKPLHPFVVKETVHGIINSLGCM